MTEDGNQRTEGRRQTTEVRRQKTEYQVLTWHGLPARENTAKMAVPQRNQQRLNTYLGWKPCLYN